MKTWRLIIIPVVVICGSICWEGCNSHKVTEPEARIRAAAMFEHICTIPYATVPIKLYYQTNEFIEPTLTIGMGAERNELTYQYVWRHKTANCEVVVTVHESGELGGGKGPITYDEQKKTAP